MVLYMLKNKYVWMVLVVLILGYFAMDGKVLGFAIWEDEEPVSVEDFAKCLGETETKMYGAYWCGYSRGQKGMFGSFWEYVNYVECSTDSGEQTEECTEAGIDGYPTWIFPDGSRLSGRLSFETIAENSGCKV